MAPSALWAHMKITARAKRGSCICGMATRSWPASEVIKSLLLSAQEISAARGAGKWGKGHYGRWFLGILMLAASLPRPRGARRGLALVLDRSRPRAAYRRLARCGQRRQRDARIAIRASAALEDLLALAGRCGLSAAPGLERLEESGIRRDRLAGAAALLGAGSGDHGLYRRGGVAHHRAARRAAGKALSLDAALDYLTCNDICIPYETKLRLDLPAGSPRPARRRVTPR